MLCGSLDGRGVWGRMDTDMCVAEIETISYIPTQNEKLKKKKFQESISRRGHCLLWGV